MLFLLAFPQISVNCAQFQLSAFSASIMSDFGISLTGFSAVVFSYSIMTGIMAAFGGALEDRFGVYKVMAISGAVSSVAALIRLFAGSFPVFFLMSIFIGTVQGTGTAAMGKVINKWFEEKNRSAAMAIPCCGGALGIVLGQLLSPLFPDYRMAMILPTALIICTAVMWLFFGKSENSSDRNSELNSTFAYLKAVAGLKNVWIVAVCCAFFALMIFGTANLLPQVFINTRGMTESEAVFATGMLNVGSIPGTFIIPQIQKRAGRYKPVIAAELIICAASFFAMMFCGSAVLPLFVFFVGLFGGTIVAFYFVILTALPGVNTSTYASANGIAVMVEHVAGNFVLATFVLTPLVNGNSFMFYTFMIVMCAVMIILTMILPETGNRSKRTG